MLVDLITFEVENRYYIQYYINGKQFSKRISFEHFCEIQDANKRNELITI